MQCVFAAASWRQDKMMVPIYPQLVLKRVSKPRGEFRYVTYRSHV